MNGHPFLREKRARAAGAVGADPAPVVDRTPAAEPPPPEPDAAQEKALQKVLPPPPPPPPPPSPARAARWPWMLGGAGLVVLLAMLARRAD